MPNRIREQGALKGKGHELSGVFRTHLLLNAIEPISEALQLLLEVVGVHAAPIAEQGPWTILL